MTLELDLSPQLEARLRSEAERRGEAVGVLAVQLIPAEVWSAITP